MKNIDLINLYHVFEYCKNIKDSFKGRVPFIMSSIKNHKLLEPLVVPMIEAGKYPESFIEYLDKTQQARITFSKKDEKGEPITKPVSFKNGKTGLEYDIKDPNKFNKYIEELQKEYATAIADVKTQEIDIDILHQSEYLSELPVLDKLDLSNVPDYFETNIIELLINFNLIQNGTE